MVFNGPTLWELRLNDGDKTWRRALAGGVVDAQEIARRGWILASELKHAAAIEAGLAIRVPKEAIAAIEAGDASIAKQFVPSLNELTITRSEVEDPVGDVPHQPMRGLVHRYPDRVLLKPFFHCASYCRFCFRRFQVAKEKPLSKDELAAIFAYIAQHPEVTEVIISGGEPMMMTDRRLACLLAQISAIPHVELVRIHSRAVTLLPERITPEFVHLLRSSSKPVWWVVHINAANEWTAAACDAARRLVDGGVPLLSQSVLLKGVNNTVDQLLALFRQCLRLRVKPYYLHYPDLARGTHHFRIPLDEAIALVSELRGKLPGYGVPELVVDIPGGHGKVPVGKRWAERLESGEWCFTSPCDGSESLVHYEI